MAKCRKKPVVIDAWQFVPGVTPWPEQVMEGPDGNYYVDSMEGKMRITPGDWLMRGVRGEYYVCAKDIFAETYDLLGMGDE